VCVCVCARARAQQTAPHAVSRFRPSAQPAARSFRDRRVTDWPTKMTGFWDVTRHVPGLTSTDVWVDPAA